LNNGYTHLILIGNGFIDVGTTPCITCWIMFVLFFGPFHHAPRWYTNGWRYFLLCQCHYMNLNGLLYDMTGVVFYLKGRRFMLILRNQSTSLYMISLTNGKIAGHWPIVSFQQTLLWFYRWLFTEQLSWWAMVLTNPFSWPK
jgi:hypothetical protein